MKPRLLLGFLALALAGIVAWTLWTRDSASKPTVPRNDAAHAKSQKPSVISEKENEATSIPRSARHAKGEVQKEQAIRMRLAELDSAIRDQEDRVEEKRKVLAAIVRAKGIVYDPSKPMPSNPESEKLTADSQDYVEFKRDLETSNRMLEEMRKLRVTEKARIAE